MPTILVCFYFVFFWGGHRPKHTNANKWYVVRMIIINVNYSAFQSVLSSFKIIYHYFD